MFFGIEDHGILVLSLTLNFGDYTQSTGGQECSWWPEGETRPRGMIYGTDFMCALLDFFDVKELDKIKGVVVYGVYDKEDIRGNILGLERTPFDGGKRLLFTDWRENCKEWEKRLMGDRIQ